MTLTKTSRNMAISTKNGIPPETIAAILTLIGAFGKGRTKGLGSLGAGFLQGRSARQRQKEAETASAKAAKASTESK